MENQIDIQADRARKTLGLLRDGVLETLYPTRCAVCDRPGTLLCATCEHSLSYVDYWHACPRCGGAWGWRQCTDCNRVALGAFGLERLPFDSCRNALDYDKATKSIVSAYKDQGEQRLAQVMARISAQMVSPELAARIDYVTFIPATIAAIRRRSFDHAELLAQGVGQELELPALSLLRRPRTIDQRILHKKERQANMKGAFSPLEPGNAAGLRLLLVDDVMTTGSTLFDASATLKKAGAREVHALTFAHAI